ncbi:LysE family translocator [Roseibium aggregatum]|uniref:LysE family translocator n=1 Tax=Roseibium aggregatum TaxID=187304 RepID=A0A926P0S9_9HYPH|nr:LysE family translocator [Roseibium aggregatum]MBD1547725.1 LysE family translocator [Roseibium aggregatum]
MPAFETLMAFAAATLLFAYFPGPALLYTAAQTLSRGRAAGFWAAFGIHIGCYVHVIAATLGLSAVFAVVPTLYAGLKLAGGAYLVWLGIQMIRTRTTAGPTPQLPARSRRRAFFDSVIVEILNPKAAVFFIAFLPQFVDVNAGLPVWAQFLILGTIVNLSFSSADVFTVLFASQVQKQLRKSSRWQDVSRWISGSILVALGFKLAMERG